MGARGPAPTPTKILELRGSWRANERKGEIQYPPGNPSCPAFLRGDARAEWRRQVKQLKAVGLLADVDRAMLAAYCEAWGDFVEVVEACRATIKAEGYAEAIAKGLVNAKAKAVERLSKLGQQFGFSPASRARVKAAEAPEERPSDDDRRFFGDN